jgi:hypothetical protein
MPSPLPDAAQPSPRQPEPPKQWCAKWRFKSASTHLPATFQIGKIIAQKDNYAPIAGKPFDAPDFMESSAAEAEVLHFKRLVVKGKVAKSDRTGEFTVVISLRGNFVTISTDRDGPLTPREVWRALFMELAKYDLGQQGLQPIELNPDAKAVVCTTADGLRLADALHHIRDQGGFSSLEG